MATTDRQANSIYDGPNSITTNLSSLSLCSTTSVSDLDTEDIFQKTVAAAAEDCSSDSSEDLDKRLFYDVEEYTEVRTVNCQLNIMNDSKIDNSKLILIIIK